MNGKKSEYVESKGMNSKDNGRKFATSSIRVKG